MLAQLFKGYMPVRKGHLLLAQLGGPQFDKNQASPKKQSKDMSSKDHIFSFYNCEVHFGNSACSLKNMLAGHAVG